MTPDLSYNYNRRERRKKGKGQAINRMERKKKLLYVRVHNAMFFRVIQKQQWCGLTPVSNRQTTKKWICGELQLRSSPLVL